MKSISLAFLFITILACALPTVGAAPANTPAVGGVLFKDDFSSPTSGWDHTRVPEGIKDYDGGGYRMMVNGLQTNFWSTPHKDFGDTRIEVDAGKLGGPDENRIGLLCRLTGEDYYFFIISSDGYYGIGLFKGGQASLLGQTEMQASDQIRTGAAVNHLRADCKGDDLAFYVNGTRLAEVHDSTLTHGDAGLLAGTFNQPGVDIVFDNFVIMKP